ncbi:MAG: sensor histidine kinase [Patescibacteria group bacterium]
MPFVAILFLVFALFMAARVPRGYQATWLGLITLTFACCILGLIGLISRFGNYHLEGIMALPLDQPGWAWRILAHLSLDEFVRYRLWSAVGFMLAVAGFSISYTKPGAAARWQKSDWCLAGAVVLLAAGLLWFYDPGHLFTLYKAGAALAPDPGRAARWARLLLYVDGTAQVLVILALVLALARIIRLLRRAAIVQKRAQALCVGVGVGVLSLFYAALFCSGPAGVLNARVMATALLPVPNYPEFDVTLLRVMPLAALVAMGAVALSIVRYGFLGTWRVGTRDLDRQINMANQAARLALHAFKNRFLAAQMAMDLALHQLDEMKGDRPAGARAQIRRAREICAEGLSQLDVLHRQAGRLRTDPTVLSWRAVWEQALARCEDRLSGIEVETVIRSADVLVWGDREHLVACVENLLQNACDAVSERRGEDSGPGIRVEIGCEYEWGYVRITDNGRGIPKENVRQVFRPFFTTKPALSNWGMGLAYCHRVIKAYRGFINLRSRVGAGTTVEIVLRCRENPRPRVSSARAGLARAKAT